MTNTDQNTEVAGNSEAVTTSGKLPVVAENSPAFALSQKYADKKRVIIPSGSDLTAFQTFVQMFDEDDLSDWTEVDYENPTYMLLISDNGENRAIALPSKSVALADPVVASEAYDFYLARAYRAAKKEDAAAALFKTPGGFFLGLDKEAFNFQADEWITFLNDKKGAKINAKRFRLTLSSEAYAKTAYAKVPQEFWVKILNGMVEKATKTGHNVALLEHWIATRAVTSVDMGEFTWNADEIEAVAHSGEATPPATAPAQPVPASA